MESTAVVAAKRNLTQNGHLPTTRFVQDLARLGILRGNDFRCLGGREV